MKVKTLVVNALIAALYVAVSLLLPFGFGPIQIRVSEALTLLPFLQKDTVWGVSAGCLLSNLLNPFGVNPLDVLFGTLATLTAAILTAHCKKLIIAPIPPIVVNMLIMGPVLAYIYAPDLFRSSSVMFGLQVGVGQLIACFGLGIPLILLVKKLKILG